MWARICEIIIGIWLIASHFIFGSYATVDTGCAILIFLFAGASYIDAINKMHLLQIIPAGWLLYISYSYDTPWLPFFLQNYILSALFLLLFCIIPSHASDAPRAWKPK